MVDSVCDRCDLTKKLGGIINPGKVGNKLSEVVCVDCGAEAYAKDHGIKKEDTIKIGNIVRV